MFTRQTGTLHLIRAEKRTDQSLKQKEAWERHCCLDNEALTLTYMFIPWDFFSAKFQSNLKHNGSEIEIIIRAAFLFNRFIIFAESTVWIFFTFL